MKIGVYNWAKVKEYTEKPIEGMVYIAEEDGIIQFLCPCGCEHVYFLNTLTDAKPCWTHIINPDNTITISPSIQHTIGCRSHFSIKNGRVE